MLGGRLIYWEEGIRCWEEGLYIGGKGLDVGRKAYIWGGRV